MEGDRLYLFIEEIPFDEDNEDFKSFVTKISSFILYGERTIKKKVILVLSSIANPIKNLECQKEKIKGLIYFKRLEEWTDEECTRLIDILKKASDIEFSNEYKISTFIQDMEKSPRSIKNIMKTICSLDQSIIEKEIVDKIKI